MQWLNSGDNVRDFEPMVERANTVILAHPYLSLENWCAQNVLTLVGEVKRLRAILQTLRRDDMPESHKAIIDKALE